MFVYGTLVLDQVIRTLIDRVPAHEPATAHGWRAVRLPDRPYPGLVPNDGQAHGRLYNDLTATEWATLDAFEDPIYVLTTIVISPGARPALAYIWPNEHLPSTWTLDNFNTTNLTPYLERCAAWRERYQQNC